MTQITPEQVQAWARDVIAEIHALRAENEALRKALESFTKSAYIKKQHPKRYAAAVAALAAR